MRHRISGGIFERYPSPWIKYLLEDSVGAALIVKVRWLAMSNIQSIVEWNLTHHEGIQFIHGVED